jgi:uncharacterized protein YdcH (DUF465 family)
MSMMGRQIREQLLAFDAEFQRLADEHSRYEAQLQQLTKTPYVSVENLLLESALKKKKLRVKDEMERRIALAAHTSVTH